MICMTVKHLHKCGYLYCDSCHCYARTDKNCVCVQDKGLKTTMMTTIPVTANASLSELVVGKIAAKMKIEHNDDDMEIDTTPALLEQCFRFLEIKAKRPNTVTVHVIRLNAVDLN